MSSGHYRDNNRGRKGTKLSKKNDGDGTASIRVDLRFRT